MNRWTGFTDMNGNKIHEGDNILKKRNKSFLTFKVFEYESRWWIKRRRKNGAEVNILHQKDLNRIKLK